MEKPHIPNRVATFVKMPLIEIVGQNRVLIENHNGVLGYSLEEIQVKVNFGRVQIIGKNLRIMQLCKDQLVITGSVEAVQLYGR